jgi:hypothetical protein
MEEGTGGSWKLSPSNSELHFAQRNLESISSWVISVNIKKIYQ